MVGRTAVVFLRRREMPFLSSDMVRAVVVRGCGVRREGME